MRETLGLAFELFIMFFAAMTAFLIPVSIFMILVGEIPLYRLTALLDMIK